MTTTANIDDELKAIAAAETPLRALEATLEAELKDAEAQRPTPQNHNRPFDLRETLRQLRDGVPISQGMDSRLYAVLSSPVMRGFRFHAPGLASLLRLRARLLDQQRAASAPPAVPVLLEWRFTGKPWGKVAGQRRQTGDVLRLSEQEAERWASVLERLEPTGSSVAGGAVSNPTSGASLPVGSSKNQA